MDLRRGLRKVTYNFIPPAPFNKVTYTPFQAQKALVREGGREFEDVA